MDGSFKRNRMQSMASHIFDCIYEAPKISPRDESDDGMIQSDNASMYSQGADKVLEPQQEQQKSKSVESCVTEFCKFCAAAKQQEQRAQQQLPEQKLSPRMIRLQQLQLQQLEQLAASYEQQRCATLQRCESTDNSDNSDSELEQSILRKLPVLQLAIPTDNTASSVQIYLNPIVDKQTAGMRIFIEIMMNSWRRRRERCKFLEAQVADLKAVNKKAFKQINVYSTLFHVEHRRNLDLMGRMQHITDKMKNMQEAIEKMSQSIVSLNADRAILSHRLKLRDNELSNMEKMHVQNKSELYNAYTDRRKSQMQFTSLQRTYVSLKNQHEILSGEMSECTKMCMEKDKLFRDYVTEKSRELQEAGQKIELLDSVLEGMRCDYERCLSCIDREKYYLAEIDRLNNKLNSRNDDRAHGFFKDLWGRMVQAPGLPLYIFHLCSAVLLTGQMPNDAILPYKLTFFSKKQPQYPQ